MMTLASNRVLALTLTALLAAPASALAQSPQRPSQAPAPPAASPGKPASPGGAAGGVEQSVKELHAQLKITQAQEPQWQPFAQAMRENALDVDQTLTQRGQQTNAVQEMEAAEKLAEAQVKHLQKMLPVFQTLYAALSPEQKKRADEIFRAPPEGEAGGSGPR
jgi:protein CpxP